MGYSFVSTTELEWREKDREGVEWYFSIDYTPVHGVTVSVGRGPYEYEREGRDLGIIVPPEDTAEFLVGLQAWIEQVSCES